MNRRTLLTTFLLLLLAAAPQRPSTAQSNNPFAPILWPKISSPTPIRHPTLAFTPTGTVSPVPSATPIPIPTWDTNGDDGLGTYSGFDAVGIDQQLSKMQDLITGSTTGTTINGIDGQPVNMSQVTNLAGNGQTLLGYIKGLTTINVGFLNPLVGLLLMKFTITLTITMLGFAIPIGAALFGILRKIIGIILDFIPG